MGNAWPISRAASRLDSSHFDLRPSWRMAINRSQRIRTRSASLDSAFRGACSAVRCARRTKDPCGRSLVEFVAAIEADKVLAFRHYVGDFFALRAVQREQNFFVHLTAL